MIVSQQVNGRQTLSRRSGKPDILFGSRSTSPLPSTKHFKKPNTRVRFRPSTYSRLPPPNSSPVPTTITQPITLYQRNEIPVKK